MFAKKSVRDIDVKGKKVLVRVDFNVPIKDGIVQDDTRIRAAMPTIQYLLDQGAAVILFSHLGRPKGGPDPKFSMKPVADYLATLMKKPVAFADDCVGEPAEKAAAALKPGGVLVLENTRFHPEEEKNDLDLAKKMAALADIYVNDAFGSAHRAHSSTEGVARFLPAVSGFLMEKEIEYLGQAIDNPKRPFVAILGGAKVSDKIGVIKNLLAKADTILIGGGMANTFFKAEGYPIGKSLVEDEVLDLAKELIAAGKTKLRLPVDVVIAEKMEEGAETRVIPVGPIPEGSMILDIGPKTLEAYSKVIGGAATVVWNGPMGVSQKEPLGLPKRWPTAIASASSAAVIRLRPSKNQAWQTKSHISPPEEARPWKCSRVSAFPAWLPCKINDLLKRRIKPPAREVLLFILYNFPTLG
jgi:phosphoglycerate kinase